MANEVGKAYVSIIPSMRGFSNDIRRQLKRELAGVDAEVKGKVDFDARKVASDAAKAIKEAQAAVPDLKGVQIDVDRDGLIRKVRLAANVAEKTAPKIKIDTEISTNASSFLRNLGGNPLRAFGKIADDLIGILTRGLTPAFGGAASAAAQVTATAVSLIAVTGALIAVFLALAVVIGGVLAVAIGSVIAGLAAAAVAIGVTLPSAALALGPAIASLAFIFEGFGKIITAVTEGDLKKFDKALETLPGKAREVAAAFKPLVELKDQVQDLFFGAILEGFGGKLPAAIDFFREKTLEATKSFSNFTRDLIKNFATAENKIKLDRIFQAGKNVLDSILGGVGKLAKGFFDVAHAGASGFEKIGASAGRVLEKLGESLSRLADDGTIDRILTAFSSLIDTAGPALIQIFEDLAANAPSFLAVFEQLLPVLPPLFAAISDFLIAAGPGFVEFLNGLTELFKDPAFIDSMIRLGDAIGRLLIAVTPLLPLLIPILNFFTGLAFAAALAAGILNFFLGVITGVVNFVKGIFFGGAILQFDLLKIAANALRAAFNFLVGAARLAVSGIISAFSLLTQIPGIISEVFARVRAAFNAALGFLTTAARAIVNGIISGFKTAIRLASQVGSDIVQGLINGVKAMAKRAADAAIAVVKGAWEAAKNFLGSHSPSKLLAELGKDFTVGFSIGILSAARMAAGAAQSMTDQAVAAVTTSSLTHMGIPELEAPAVNAIEKEDVERQIVLVADGTEIAKIVNRQNQKLAWR